MMYPPTYRSIGTVMVGVVFGLAAIAGAVVSPSLAQCLACLIVGIIAFGLVALEFRKPLRPRGGRRRANTRGHHQESVT